jgi:hypothetical protein
MKTRLSLVLLLLMFVPGAAAQMIHKDCHDKTDRAERVFAIGYVAAVLDSMDDDTDGLVYTWPRNNVTYEQALVLVCEFIDRHPELWTVPSRDAIRAAGAFLWKYRPRKHRDDPAEDTSARLEKLP